jgi:DNA-binding transcriptional LysR family regulator
MVEELVGMQIDSLKYFHDACRYQSMTQAAQLNRVSRPAISQAIKNLESSLDTPLLHHKKRGFELTAAGQRVSAFASQVFDSIEQLKIIAMGHENQQLTGHLNIGLARVLSTYRVDDVLASLKKDHPKISIKIRLDNSETLLDQLVSRELDLAVLISDEERGGLVSEVLHEGHYVLLRPRSIPKNDVTYALSERRAETDAARRLYRRETGKDLPVFAEVPSWDTIWNWVQINRCGGLVPDLFLKRVGAKSGGFKIEIPQVHPYQVSAFMRDRQLQHPLTVEFMKRVRARFLKNY